MAKTKTKIKPKAAAKPAPKKQAKRAAKKAPTKPAAKKTTSAAAPFTSTNGRLAYEHFRPEAEAITGEIRIARFDVSITRHNVEAGVKEVTPFLAAIVREAPSTNATVILELPARAAALEYAASLVPAEARSDGSIDQTMLELSPIRHDTLDFLEIAGRRNLVDPARVAAIREGTGKLDFARDCIAIAGVFTDAADTLENKHPFTEAELARLAEGGEELREQLTPGGAPRRPKDRDPAAVLRDKLAMSLENGYALLEKAAVVKWGVAAFRAHVPPLLSRTHAAKAAPPPPPPKPPIAPTPATPTAPEPDPDESP